MAGKQRMNRQIEIKFFVRSDRRWNIKMAYKFWFLYWFIGVAFKTFQPTSSILTDPHQSGRPTKFDEEALRTLLEGNPRQTTRELAEQINCSNTTVEHHIHAMGMIHKYGNSILHLLSTDSLAQQALISASLLSWQKHQLFLGRMVTRDGKWVCYINVCRRRPWILPGQTPLSDFNADLHPKKVILCVW